MVRQKKKFLDTGTKMISFHREDGPAVEMGIAPESRQEHQNALCQKAKRSEDYIILASRRIYIQCVVRSPFVRERYYGDKEWWLDGKLNRTEGPAVEVSKGYSVYTWWYLGRREREEWPDKPTKWKKNNFGNQCLQENEWWINGKRFTKKEFNEWKAGCQGKD